MVLARKFGITGIWLKDFVADMMLVCRKTVGYGSLSGFFWRYIESEMENGVDCLKDAMQVTFEHQG